MRKITVIGCGQILVGDDGLGVRVVEALQKMDLPENVEVIDAGVGGLAILSMIENSEKSIIVDAVHTGKEAPGFIYHFTDKELPPPNMFMLSAHDLNLVDTIHIGREMEKLGEQKMPCRYHHHRRGDQLAQAGIHDGNVAGDRRAPYPRSSRWSSTRSKTLSRQSARFQHEDTRSARSSTKMWLI